MIFSVKAERPATNVRSEEVAFAVHPVCGLFPLMDDADPVFGELMDSIATHGLIDPIVLALNGSILDGRHRWKACNLVGVEPQYVQFADLSFKGTEGSFAFARNLSRRDLTPDQRAVITAQYYEYVMQEPDRQSKLAKKQARAPSGTFEPLWTNDHNGDVPHKRTHEAVQEKANVSERKARQALEVVAHAPEMAQQVKEGKVSLREAQKVAQTKKPARPRKPKPFDFENYVDKAERAIKKIFSNCPEDFRKQLKPRVVAIVEDQ